MMKQITKNFKLSELIHSNTAVLKGIKNIPNDKEVIELTFLVEKVLQPLRDLIAKPIIISSGFRNEEVNKLIGGVVYSQHRKGQAADINATGLTARELFKTIIQSDIPFDQVILYDNAHNHFVHISYNKDVQRHQILYSKGTKPL